MNTYTVDLTLAITADGLASLLSEVLDSQNSTRGLDPTNARGTDNRDP